MDVDLVGLVCGGPGNLTGPGGKVPSFQLCLSHNLQKDGDSSHGHGSPENTSEVRNDLSSIMVTLIQQSCPNHTNLPPLCSSSLPNHSLPKTSHLVESKQEKVGRKMWVEWQGEAEGQKVGVEQRRL